MTRRWWIAHFHAIAGAFRAERDLPLPWRLGFRTILAVSAVTIFAFTARHNFRDPLPTQANIQILARLDEFTRRAGPDVSNTIPEFLAQPGALGVIRADAPAAQLVRGIDEAVLRRGLCSTRTARLVRHEYPGFYDDWPDQRLESSIAETHPEYGDRLCSLSAQLDAAPGDIVKYDLTPRTFFAQARLGLWTVFVTAAFAALSLLVYYGALAAFIAARSEEMSPAH